MTSQQKIANALLDIKAVRFLPTEPIRYKSGLLSPVYVDNRSFPFYPEKWKIVMNAFKKVIKENNLDFDIIAGIESAGIPHSAALGQVLQKPSVFVRKQIKGHGTKKKVEGGDVNKKRVLLIEDHITTGGSSLTGAENLRAEGGIVEHCLAITSYGFAIAKKQFDAAKVQLHTLTTFDTILNEAVAREEVTIRDQEKIQDWFTDSWGWEKKHGYE